MKETLEFAGKNHETCGGNSKTAAGSAASEGSSRYAYQGTPAAELRIRKRKRAGGGEAKRAARTRGVLEAALIPDRKPALEGEPQHDKDDQKLISQLNGNYNADGWAHTPEGHTIVPSIMLRHFIRREHQKRHRGAEDLYKYLVKDIAARNLYTTVRQVTQQCDLCLRTNPKATSKVEVGRIGKGNAPGLQWQVDFTELPRKGAFQYLLVLTDTFSGWPEASPTRTAKAREVTRILIQEIIWRFGLPVVISSDRGPHFISKVLQPVSNCLGFKWQLHIPYYPQSSGQVE